MSDKKTGFFQSIKYSLSNWDPFGTKKRHQIRIQQESMTNEFRQWLSRERSYLQSPEGLQKTGVAELINLINGADVFLRYSDRYIFFGNSSVEYRLDLEHCALYSVHAEIGVKKQFVYDEVQSPFVLGAVNGKEDAELKKIHALQILREARKRELCGLAELDNTQKLSNLYLRTKHNQHIK
ncbi:MAG: hypothetical protein ACLRFN_02935 [Alphaproteobacteria bacterium]